MPVYVTYTQAPCLILILTLRQVIEREGDGLSLTCLTSANCLVILVGSSEAYAGKKPDSGAQEG